MALPKPHDGLVIRYGYLWHWQHKQGQEEGKDRPCMILRFFEKPDTGERRAIVLPISHTAPDQQRYQEGIKLPAETNRRLGLDDEQSWLIVSESNRFTWPGPDVRPVDANRDAYGPMPPGLYAKSRDRYLERARARQTRTVERTDANPEVETKATQALDRRSES